MAIYSLEWRQEKLPQIEKLIKFAKLYGGKIAIGDDTITLKELEEFRLYLKSEITAGVSQRILRLIK